MAPIRTECQLLERLRSGRRIDSRNRRGDRGAEVKVSLRFELREGYHPDARSIMIKHPHLMAERSYDELNRMWRNRDLAHHAEGRKVERSHGVAAAVRHKPDITLRSKGSRLASPGRNQGNSERGINEATERTSGEGDRPRCAGIMGLARTCLDVENPLGGYLAAHVLTNRFAFRRRRRSRKGLRSCRLRESTRRHARPMRDLHASNKPCSITSRYKFKLWLKLRNLSISF